MFPRMYMIRISEKLQNEISSRVQKKVIFKALIIGIISI
jgi:hypothetical protein